ncbi:hypothetical protein A9Q79_09280 [Methylophaga sp. 42_25_T18]|nr:hypothetical protein A9Q79_09280 [Methylophaga sp. 42_25_T18]OUR88531.1 hypothetical protein A9Q92_02860 [Methylophaga sp. 42_8_T64]
MIRFEKFVLILIVLAVTLPIRQVFATTEEPVSDVRILIDVSGSMKKNDPNNLRAPALRLVIGLLPDESKAGVWTFAKYVNMLVPIRDVNEAWKIEAERQSNKIHSYGLFTNIEQVLNKATASHKLPDANVRRSVILLSDGLVDVAAGEETSEKSRQRILDNIVPRLKKSGVAVHTIALSSTADHELLRAISIATDGWYEQVDTADQLQRVFLHLFEKAAQRDTVPLTDNNFKIDDSVSEMTLLVFRSEGTRDTELVLPDLSRLKNDELPGNVRWHHEDNYDLITIEQPLTGDWKIDADLDPDNRVMVVTDLKLQTTDLPNNILIGETFDFSASLTDKDEVIVREDFLKLVDAQLKEENELADAVLTDLNESQQQGVYLTHIGDLFQPGRNDVVVTMTSATFERQRRQSINVVETPFDVQVEQLTDEDTRTHRLTLKPDVELIKSENVSIAAMLTAADGSEWSYDVMKNLDGDWQLTLADLQPSEDYSLALQIRGETVKGRSLFLQPTPIILIDRDIPEEIAEIELPVMEEEEAELEPEMEPEAELEEIIEEMPMEEEQLEPELEVIDEMNGNLEDLLPEPDEDLLVGLDPEMPTSQDEGVVTPAIKLAIGNGIILMLVGIGVFVWRRKSAATNPGDEL